MLNTARNIISSDATTQQMIAPVIDTLVATKNYSIGEEFIYAGTLYKVISAISVGDTIILGSGGNADTADTITEQLDEFTSSVSPVNSVVTFNNLNPDYGYKLYADLPDETAQLPTNLTNITVRKWTNKKRSTNSDGTINLAYTVTDTSIQYCLRILK